MEIINHNVQYLPLPFTILSIILTLVWWRRILKKPRLNSPKLPPGPPKLPIIGNLHLMIGKLPHHYLTDSAKKYGPVMCIQMGQVPTFIFSTVETAKAVLKTHDLVFASRPLIHALKQITYNQTDVGLAPYGNYWREIRKICSTEVFSPALVRSFRPIREEEVSSLVRLIASNAGRVINLREMLTHTALSIITRVTMGDKCKHQEEFKKLLPHVTELISGFSLVDLFPSFKLLHLVHAMSLSPKSKKLHLQADRILENIVMEHKAIKATGLTERRDFLYVLLDHQDRGDLEVPLTTENIKAIILDMLVAGTDSVSATIDWAMSELVRNPRVMEKAQAEVRHVYFAGRKGTVVDEAGLEELNYLKLVIKETFRLHPPAPFLLPRESRQRCEINGYEIPAKSRVLVNVWALGRDPNYWTEAESFFPERFLDSNIDYRGNNLEFLPFGAGRRMCAGLPFAPPVLELQLASLLFHFDWKLPDGQAPQSLAMTEVYKTVAKRKHDLCLIPIPYHHPMH